MRQKDLGKFSQHLAEIFIFLAPSERLLPSGVSSKDKQQESCKLSRLCPQWSSIKWQLAVAPEKPQLHFSLISPRPCRRGKY